MSSSRRRFLTRSASAGAVLASVAGIGGTSAHAAPPAPDPARGPISPDADLLRSLPQRGPLEAGVYFQVLDTDRVPVSGATVALDGYGKAVTNSNGVAIITANLKEQEASTTLRVTAGSAGSHVERQFPISGGGNQLHGIDLTGGSDERLYYGVDASQAHGTADSPVQAAGTFRAAVAGTMCNGHTSTTTPPSSIRVARRSGGSPAGAITGIDTVDYQVYVRKSLAHEWIPSWATESLKAGGLAVKDYAWSRARAEGGKTWSGQCWDVDDTTNYQVYGNSSDSRTTSAVDVAWNYWGFKSGAVFTTNYTAGSYTTCGAGATGSHMYQWGTKKCADDGKNYKQIFSTYYYPNVTYQYI